MLIFSKILMAVTQPSGAVIGWGKRSICGLIPVAGNLGLPKRKKITCKKWAKLQPIKKEPLFYLKSYLCLHRNKKRERPWSNKGMPCKMQG